MHKCEKNNDIFRATPSYSQDSMAQEGSKPHACAKGSRNHSGMCLDGSTGFFQCVQNAHFLRECPKNRQGNGNGETESSLIQLLHQKEFHLEDLHQGLMEQETIFMISFVGKRKRIL